MNCYYELIAAIRALSEKSFFDILFDRLVAIGPIVLSVIAIGISIWTTIRQSKIDLFEKRYCVLNTVMRIIWLSENIEDPENLYITDKKQHGKFHALSLKSRRVCAAYNSMFGTDLDYAKKEEESFSIYASVYAVQKELMMAEFLFCPEIDELLFAMIGAMAQYMVDTVSHTEDSSSRELFREKCSEFETKWLPKLEKETRITRGSHLMRG